jgi:hypothetical protein
MKKEDCEKGQELLQKISQWEKRLNSMKSYNEKQEGIYIFFGNYDGFADQATAKACMALLINNAEETLKKFQKEFDAL